MAISGFTYQIWTLKIKNLKIGFEDALDELAKFSLAQMIQFSKISGGYFLINVHIWYVKSTYQEVSKIQTKKCRHSLLLLISI